MGWGESALQYRKAALHSSSPIGTVVMLYDQLIKDLRLASIAMRDRKYESCAGEIKHALTVVQQLECLVDRDSGEPCVPWLLKFYPMLRQNILSAQVKASAEALEAQAKLALDVRGAWQELEQRLRLQELEPLGQSPEMNDTEAGKSSWSA